MKSPLHIPAHERQPVAAGAKKTLLIYSPDVNFCSSLSMLFQESYDVVTTTSIGAVNEYAGEHAADLVLIDAVPTEKLIERLDRLKEASPSTAVIMLYVYSAREKTLDATIRNHVNSVFYKPVEMTAVSQRIQELLAD
jgi:DNA-binding NarL/FixJ family response regulator